MNVTAVLVFVMNMPLAPICLVAMNAIVTVVLVKTDSYVKVYNIYLQVYRHYQLHYLLLDFMQTLMNVTTV